MNRIRRVLLAAAAPGLLLFAVFSAWAQTPNVLVIMADDLDARSTYRLIQLQKMPNLVSAVLASGMIFPEAFVTNSSCCPSRASFLTGQYSHNNGVLTNHGANGGVATLDDSETLPVWLQNHGYFTGNIGKYLNGYGIAGETADPLGNPHDERYIPPGWDQWHALIDPTTYWMYGYRINRNGTVVQYTDDPADYQTDVLAQLAVEFIDAWRNDAPGQPFFLYLNPIAPHDEVCPGVLRPRTSPECAPFLEDPVLMTVRPAPRHANDAAIYALSVPTTATFNEVDITDKPTWLRVQQPVQWSQASVDNLTRKHRDRLASMRAVDDMIGAVVSALGSDADNTVIVFTSDNGMQLGEHRLFGKTFVYEESIKVPLFVRMPSAPIRFASPRMVLNIDLAPTILSLVQAVESPGFSIDGRSFARLYTHNPGEAFRKRFLIEHWAANIFAPVYADYFAVRTDRYLEPNAPWQTYTVYEYPTTVPQTIEHEHYDLNSDRAQDFNVYDESAPTAVQLELQSFVDQLKTCAGASCRTLEDAVSP